MISNSVKTDRRILEYSRTIGIFADEGRGFQKPVDLVFDKHGRILVLNRAANWARIGICNLDEEYLGEIGSFGKEDGQWIWGTALALDNEGRLYVSDEYMNRITIFDTSGEFFEKWGAQGKAVGQLNGPSGMCFDAEDNLYVVDHRNHRIQKFTKRGEYLDSFGSYGDGNGEFNLPWGITIDISGNIFVADWRNDRIQKFTHDGEFIGKYGMSGSGDGEFNRPSSVAVDSEGYIYVADWGNERVQILDSHGKFVMKLRGDATLSAWAKEFLSVNEEESDARDKANLNPHKKFISNDPHIESSQVEKYFWAPISVKLDINGNLYVTENNRYRIQIYKRRHALNPTS